MQAYYEYMVDIATLLGAERHRAEVELKESLQFEMKLANVSVLQPFNGPLKLTEKKLLSICEFWRNL